MWINSKKKMRPMLNSLWSRFALLLFLVLFWAMFFGPVSSYASDRSPWRIVVLQSYHADFSWTEDIMEGIHTVFDNAGQHAEFYIEYMDIKRFPKLLDTERLSYLQEHLTEKYRTLQPHAIITVDDDALRFLIDLHESIFPGVPIVFCGVNNPIDEGKVAAQKVITGVMEVLDRKETIDAALALHPEAKKLAVITDTTTNGIGNRLILKELANGYAGRIQFVFLDEDGTGMTLDVLRSRLSNLDDETIVYYGDFFRDKNDFIDQEIVIPILSTESRRPIYSPYSFIFGLGTVGGKLNSALFQGEAAAKMTIQILSGTSPHDIPVMKESINRFMFDFRQMERWNIPIDRLPAGSMVMYKPISFFEAYRGLVIGTVIVFIILLSAIGALLVNIYRRKQAEEGLRHNQAMLARTESIAHVGSWEWDVATGAVIWSDELFRIFQLNPADGAPSFADQRKLYYPEDIQQLRKAVDAAVGNGKSYEMEMRAVRKDGATRVCLARGYAEKCLKKNSVIRLYGSLQDITDLKRAEQDYSMLFHKMLNGFALHEIICDESGKPTDYRFLAVNPVFERMTGLKAEKIVGRTVLEVMPYTEYNWIETYGKVAMTGTPIFFENYSSELNKYFEISSFRPNPNQFACIFADITERKKAEAEKIKLEGQLHQAQKLESVGRLAGGVAHDFNNMLSIILGHAEMALSQLEPDEAIHTSLEEIREAANRSANLTRQLLAFARRQTISPRKLDLNETIEGMLKLLQRLIGEDIDIVWLPGKNLWSVKMDPTQIDQILANLCINSRDSISGVGKMTIETRNCIFDKDYSASHLDFAPGEYVMLTVSDNGCGMDKETQAHIFEPFFTTKEMGKGTGLGLATVYGIIKQNSGFINVYSEVGQGSLFTAYFPRHLGESAQILNEGAAEPVKRGQETILLVEDEPAILNMTKMMLERQGYTVLSASKPSEAVRMAEAHPDKIDLLITDVVMPEISGWNLANNLLTLYPNIKRLFMSGYTANVIAHNGVLDPGVNFIQKPFSIQNLAAKVRESLDESNRKNKDDACDDE